jgi:hypothetical protein
MNLYRYSINLIFIVFLFASPFLLAQEDYLWAKGFGQVSGTSSTDYGQGVTTDSMGNILLTGQFQGTITFPSGVAMTSQGNFDYFLVKFDKDGNALWKRNAGSGPGSFPERGYGVRFDLLGNIITCGSFFATTTWEGGGNPDITYTAMGNLDGFIAKYDSSGKLLWVKPQASVSQIYTYKVAIDNRNNIIGCGYFGSNTSDSIAYFDTISIKSNAARDGFIAKYDPNGNAIWAKNFGGPVSYDQANSVVVDSAGNVYVCGMSAGISNFSGLTVNCDTIDSWKNGLTPDAIVAKYSPSGDIIWAKNFGGHNTDDAYDLVLDGMGHLYVSGYFDSAAVFGSLGIVNSNGNKGPDVFLIKLDTAGNAIWVRTGGGPGVVPSGGEYGYSTVVDKSGNPWMAGSFQGTGNFSGTQIISKGGEDTFIAEYNPSGDLLLLKRAGGADIDKTYNIWADQDGNIFGTGRYRDVADFGPLTIGPAWGDDIFLYKIGNALPTPVELSSFSSIINGRNITLNWETKTELNSKQFEINRALLNSHGIPSTWINVGSVKAAGTTVSPNKYSFIDKDLQTGSYQYRLKMIDNDGAFKFSNVIEAKIGIPEFFDLSQNYPNPFNPSTSIKYQLPVDAKVILEVYNITGQKVSEIVNQDQSAGYYIVAFGQTAKLSSGVYIYRIIAIDKATGNNFSSIKKMMLLK